jgi:Antitoxin VbhA
MILASLAQFDGAKHGADIRRTGREFGPRKGNFMTDQQIARNIRAVAHAIAQQELEGLTVPSATANDLRRVARGEISVGEAIRNVYARFGHVPVFEP